MDFYDRIDELARFKRFLDLPEGGLACLYGRRRIGKSRLIEEATKGRPNCILHVADTSDAALQRARLAKDISATLPGFADVTYGDWGVLFDRWRKDAPDGAVLVLDELPYLVGHSPELPSILQRVADSLRTCGRKIIICGSSQRMMQGLVLNANEPLYGRAREIVKLEPISFSWTREAFPDLSAWDRFRIYAVWGGIPRYWEECRRHMDFWEALRTLVFSPQGVFHDEPRFILQDDLRDSVQAASVLSLIGQGAHRPSEIAARLQVPATALGRPIARLAELGLVMKETPFGSDAGSGKKALYRLGDPFLKFWYAFALPNYSDPYFLSGQEDVQSMQGAFGTFLGEAWESLVRATLRKIALPGSIGRWRNVSRWWGSGLDRKPMEIDVVAESADRETLLVGEAKLSLGEAESVAVRRELEAKARQLPFAGRYGQIVPCLFVAHNPPSGAVSLDWCEPDA